jgi:mannose-6-phosphate isomerase-like protein (cupin superfamily)
MTTYRVPFGDLPWQTSPAGLRFKAHTFGDSRLRVIEITPAVAHPQWCVAGHVGYVLEGDVEIEFDHRVEHYRPGDGVVIPAGEADRHRPRALSPRVRIVFVEAASP